jgi:hypothetical protein
VSGVGPTSVWNLNGTTARLDADGFAATVDLLRPARGLHELRGPGVTLAGWSLLGVEPAITGANELSLPETYVRGDDLVATYPQSDARPFRLQLYWRRIAAGIVELQASINTSLLDTQPAIDVVTTAGDGVWSEFAPGRFLLKASDGAIGLFQAPHPADESSSRTTGARLVHHLFDRPLEKGVILRSRVRSAILASDGMEQAAEATYREFAASRPPLTT